jgi:hypothetical protein
MSWRFVLLLVMVGLVWLRVFRAARAAEPDSLLGRRISWPPTRSQLGTVIGVIALGVGYIFIVTSSGLPRYGLPLGVLLFVGGLVLLGMGWDRGRPA